MTALATETVGPLEREDNPNYFVAALLFGWIKFHIPRGTLLEG